jgi:hypothetical protein
MKEKIFNIVSIIFLLSTSIFFGNKFYKAYQDSKIVLDNTFISDNLKNSISKYTLNNSLSKDDNEYIYNSKANNNYLKYNGYLWRIIKVTGDDQLVAVSEDTITYLPFNSSIKWINITKYNKELELNYDYLDNTKICIDTFNDINNISCNEVNTDYTIGLLSLEDYIKYGGSNSYLNNGTNFWTSNKYDDTKAWYISSDGKVSSDDLNERHGIRPVITIKSNTKLISGNGTIENPYIIEQRNIKSLKDTYQGEYVRYSNNTWRIIYNKENKIKLISENYLKNTNNIDIEYYFTDLNNTIDLNNKTLYWLNSKYVKSLENKEYLIKGNYYIGTYYKEKNNYMYSYLKNIELYVGLPSINEPFIYELDNIFLSNPSNIDDLTTYAINKNNLYEDVISTKRKIRPTIYLKDNITIKSGKGTKDKPYILGGINEA